MFAIGLALIIVAVLLVKLRPKTNEPMLGLIVITGLCLMAASVFIFLWKYLP